MTLLHDAYTALLSGITYRTGNEIHWHDEDENPITVEPINVECERYMVRRYRDDDSLEWEEDYHQGQRHGKSIRCYKNGQKAWETDYVNDLRHGKHVEWYPNGRKRFELNYIQGQKHNKSMGWCDNGKLRREVYWVNNQPHGKSSGWRKDGTLLYEDYYINGQEVSIEEWEKHNDSTA